MSNQWESKPLIEAIGRDALFTDGDWIESKDQDPSGEIRLVQLADILDGSFKQKSSRFITRQKSIEMGTTMLHKGDVLIARMPDPIGRSCIFPGAEQDCVTVVDVAIARPSNCDPAWLMYYLNSLQVRSQIEEKATGTTRKRISRSALANLSLEVPPLPEQKKIAEILSGIDKCIDKIVSKAQKMRNILQGIFVELDEVENQGQTELLGEFVTIQNGYAFQSRMFTEEKDGIPLIRISDIQNGVVDLSKSKKIPANFSVSDDYIIHKGDILIAMSGATTGKVGISCSETICLLNQRVGKFSFQRSDVTNKFVSQLLLSGYLENRLLAAAAGGAQPNISGSGIEALEIPLPDESRQSNLSRAISGIRNQIRSQNKLATKYLYLKNSLSSGLLSGRKRISV